MVDEALNAVDNVPGERERTEARIQRLDDALPYLNSRMIDAEQSVEAAEWVVYIAEINDMAERERVENGFIEPTEQHWYNLRWCESRNRYSIESSNGLFYGAYQFESPYVEDRWWHRQPGPRPSRGAGCPSPTALRPQGGPALAPGLLR